MRAPLHFDAIVIGAGAAGMFCAALAGQRGRRVLLIEHYRIVGEKIRISGGGRCNFTNLDAGPANFLSGNPEFCRSALARFMPRDFIAIVERHGIRWHEKKLGQLFCDGSSNQIIAMLRAECERAGVTWWQPCPVDGVTRDGEDFAVATPKGSENCACPDSPSRNPAVPAPAMVSTTGVQSPASARTRGSRAQRHHTIDASTIAITVAMASHLPAALMSAHSPSNEE